MPLNHFSKWGDGWFAERPVYNSQAITIGTDHCFRSETMPLPKVNNFKI